MSDVLSFLFVAAWAVYEGWEPANLAWGLWIGSLSAGSLLLFLTFGTSAFLPALAKIPEKERTGQHMAAMVVIGAIFLGCFCFWHAGYIAIFDDMIGAPGPTDAASDDYADGVRQFLGIAAACVVLYWPFVLSTLVSAVAAYVRAVRTEDDDDLILGPWIGFIRLHVVTFALVGAHVIGIRSVTLVVLLAAAYLPVDRMAFAYARERRDAPEG